MNYEEHKRDNREKLKLMSNKAWAKNQSNDPTRKNLPNHCREVDAPLQCVGVEIDSLEGGDGVPEMWDKPLWESVWPYLDPLDSVRLRTASTHWNVPRKYGRHGEGR